MSKHKEITEIRLKQIEQIIGCALKDKNIQSHLKEFGITTKRLDEGKLLYKRAYELYQRNFIAHNLDNPDEFQILWNEACKYYLQLVHISRLALQNERDVYLQLGLAGSRKTSLSGWLSQANQFYINVLSNPLAFKKLNEYGITQDKLETGKQLLNKVEVAIVSCSKQNENIRQIALEYDKAIDTIEGWIYHFNTISRIALEDNPKLLSKLHAENR